MSQTTHIPGTVVKTSNLPEEVPTHLIGVSEVTKKTVKYAVADLQLLLREFTSRHDFNVYDYLGKAVRGSSESDNVWTITRLTIASDGSSTKQTATNVNWTNRYYHTYT